MSARIFPTARSIALNPRDQQGPEFEILTDGPKYFIVEVATERELFDAATHGHRRYPLITSSVNFYSSLDGWPALPFAPPPYVLGQSNQTRSNGVGRFQLPLQVWSVFRSNDRVYYRVIAGERLRQGRLEGAIEWSTPDTEYAHTPYIHILTRSVTPYYQRSTRSPARPRTPWLKVHGNELIEGRCTVSQRVSLFRKPVTMKGVNLSGLQYRRHDYGTPSGGPSRTWREAAGIDLDVVRGIASWKANIIRLPINQDWVLHGAAGKTGLDYLREIDEIIDWAAFSGMYVLLDLQLLDEHHPTQPMPNNLSMVFWRLLASRYRNDSAVFYDLCNEPRIPNEKDYYPLSSVDGFEKLAKAYPNASVREIYKKLRGEYWINLWRHWVLRLEEVIHGVHPDALLWVSGIGGPCAAASLRNMPVERQGSRGSTPQPILNAVYSAHIYYHEKDNDTDAIDNAPDPNTGTVNAYHWTYWFGLESLRRKHPIFLGEWGGEPSNFNKNYDKLSSTDQRNVETGMVAWGNALSTYLAGLSSYDQNGQWNGLAGWTAWSWGNQPHLVMRMQRNKHDDGDYVVFMDVTKREYVMTAFGEIVRSSLSR